MLICFSGIDGAGKTTLANEVIKILMCYGIDARYVAARFDSLLARIIGGLLKKIFSLDNKTRSEQVRVFNTKRSLLNKTFPATIYISYVTFAYIVQIFFKVFLSLMANRIIVCDRYVYDTAVDLAVDLGFEDHKFVNFLHIFLNFFPKPDLIFVVDVPEDMAYFRNLRKEDILYKEYFEYRRRLYILLSKELGIIPINGYKKKDELEKILSSALARFFARVKT